VELHGGNERVLPRHVPQVRGVDPADQDSRLAPSVPDRAGQVEGRCSRDHPCQNDALASVELAAFDVGEYGKRIPVPEEVDRGRRLGDVAQGKESLQQRSIAGRIDQVFGAGRKPGDMTEIIIQVAEAIGHIPRETFSGLLQPVETSPAQLAGDGPVGQHRERGHGKQRADRKEREETAAETAAREGL